MDVLAADLAMTGQQRRDVVVGLGATGVSVARFFAARGMPFAVADTRECPPGLAEIEALDTDIPRALGPLDRQWLAAAGRLIVSPGVPLSDPAIRYAREQGVQVVGDIELFAHEAQAPVAAVTGSNGKSTVVSLLSHLARAAGRRVRTGGNIGTPALDLLQKEVPDLYVLELSSFQLETVYSLRPAVAAVLNVSADHMDRYSGFGDYAAAKARIYEHAKVRIVNRDDPVVCAMASSGVVVRFGLDVPGDDDFGLRDRQGRPWLVRGRQWLLPEDALKIPGRHNTANALAALALADSLGLQAGAVAAALCGFTGLPHRTQWVAEAGGITWYNDSKGTNVGATIAAIEGMPGKVVLIAGGIGKGADFSPLAPVVARKARAVVLMGRDAPLLEASLGGAVPVRHAAGMHAAVATAGALAREGDCVLLSPACASFDQFADYAERGEAFMSAVREVLA